MLRALLQPIFLLSGLNLALVDASHHIAAKLATDHIYRPVCTKYLATNLCSRAEQSAAQTKILASKWMTWEYFKAFVVKTWDHKGCLCGKTVDEGCFDTQWPPDFEDPTTMLYTRSHMPVLAFVKVRIPIKLLRGPWATDRIQFLWFLLWITSCTVDWSETEGRKMALEGRNEAVLTKKNLEFVQLSNHNRRLGRTPDLDAVRLAVVEGGCDLSIVYDTMAFERTRCLKGDAWKNEALDNRAINNSKVFPGQMDPKTGDYDDVDEDKLVITPPKWNQKDLSGRG
ncbi:hypothetical protein K504DRAFT_501326 [Pleomassaria siparia CBS 279.74]|uniref:Uncharacterized protein n=1 Tax=Pleomassaria siparia CBS 279.74 TaxID=1314801 RepID=A0A6G1KC49_9PLEO|nr:hypothetical protein K504DRAFT_501326 [Pleomassaria siparia CBS 279.74]